MSEKQRRGQFLATFLSSGGSFVSGCSLGWSSAVFHKLVYDPNVPKKQEDCELRFCVDHKAFLWIIATLTIGAMISSIFARSVIDFLGTKGAQFIFIFPITLGWISTLFARTQIMIYAGRLSVGLSCGAYSVIVPVYINEIAEKAIRGRLLAWSQFMQYLGIAFVYGLGLVINIFQINFVCCVITAVYAVGLFFLPESPIHLIKKQETDAAIFAMKKLYGSSFDCVTEVSQLQARFPENFEDEGTSLLKNNRRALFTVFGLLLFLHASGFYPLIFTMSDIFDSCLTTIDSDTISLLIAITMLISSFISVLTIDLFGRRKLLLFSTAGMIVTSCFMVIHLYFEHCCDDYINEYKNLSVLFTSLYISFFAVGFGPVTFVMMAEMFANEISHLAMSVNVMINYFLMFGATLVFFPIMQQIEMAGIYAIFTLAAVLAFVFTIFVVRETNGKSSEEIEDLMKNRCSEGSKEKCQTCVTEVVIKSIYHR